jgi:hypothetical protein
MVDHGAMKPYSEDLRQKVVEAVEQRGTSKSEAACSASASPRSSAIRDSLPKELPLPQGREAEGLPKRTR